MISTRRADPDGNHLVIPKALPESLSLVPRRPVSSIHAGSNRSVFLGAGTEMAQLRPYQSEDDVRELDPNATARTGEPHVRVRVAEKALTIWFAVDVSPSMAFGTADRRKIDVARGAALALGQLSARGGNSIAVATFGDDDPRTLSPRSGRLGMLGLLEALRREPHLENESPGVVSPAEVFDRINGITRRRALVVVLSDFRGPRDWKKPLGRLAGRHETIAVELRDPREQEIPDVGEIWLLDPETGRQMRVDTSDHRLRQRFASAAAYERTSLAAEFRSLGMDHLVLSTKGDWMGTLASFLRNRTITKGGRR